MADLDEFVVVPDLIREVEKRPALWDETLAHNKNKSLVQSEWVDVCTVLRHDFGELEEEEKYVMMKFVVKKWTNIRDLWTKYYKKELENPLPRKKQKRYVYRDACMFLEKVYGLGGVQVNDSANEDSSNNSSSQSETKPAKRKFLDRSLNRNVQDTSIKSMSQEEPLQDDEIYLRCRRHISFFKGILPAIAHLNENDTLEFQIGVLNVIKHLKSKEETPAPAVTDVYFTPHQEIPVERMKRETSVASVGSSYNGEEEYLSEEFLDY